MAKENEEKKKTLPGIIGNNCEFIRENRIFFAVGFQSFTHIILDKAKKMKSNKSWDEDDENGIYIFLHVC